MPFLLLRTPVLCIHNILLQLTAVEQVLFSFVSKRCYRIIRTLRTAISYFDIRRYSTHSIISFRYGETFHNHWIINYPFKKPKQYPIGLSIGEEIIRTRIKKNNLHSCSVEDRLVWEALVIEYLVKLFNRTVLGVTIYSDDMKPPFLVGVSNCQFVEINGEKPLRNRHLRELIETFAPSRILNISTPITANFYVEPIHFKSKELFIGLESRWITRETFLNLPCDIIQMASSSLTSKDATLFVKQWFYSNNMTFDFLNLDIKDRVRSLELEELKPMKWSPENRSQLYRQQIFAIDFSKGVDILRKDGKLASVRIKDRRVSFAVWHTRFPDTTGLKVL